MECNIIQFDGVGYTSTIDLIRGIPFEPNHPTKHCTWFARSATWMDGWTLQGVALENVDLKTFESKISPGLFFAGEVLDVDGVTGGFNFQAAWATGWLAGEAMARPSNGPEEE